MTRRTKIIATLLSLFVPAIAVAEIEGLHIFTAGDVISSAQVNENFDRLKTAVEELQAENAALKARHIAEDLEIPVASCSDILAELETLSDKTIAPSASVTLTLEAGSHDCGTLEVRHPNGGNIILQGAGPTPADTVLHFSSHGVLVQQSGALGELAMMTLTGPLDDDASTNFDGVRILAGASIHLTDLVITKFRDGVSSIQGATAFATDVTAEQNRRNGYLAQEGGVMYLKDSVGSENSVNGYEAARGGLLVLAGSTTTVAMADDNAGYGFRAASTGRIILYGSLGGTSNGSGLALPTEGTLAADGSYIGD